ncbi:MAG: signal peptidase II [Desulfovibrionaceae bacterium]|nr:signal peptidase II [Desulfovibrionaceae bacterium]
MNKNLLKALAVAALVAVPDQITKAAVQSQMPLWSSKTVVPGFFNLVHVVNKGAAFGLLNYADAKWQTGFFVIVTLAAAAFIVHTLVTASGGDNFLVAGLGLILGGAAGNLVDRVRFGHVVDFLELHYKGFAWPAFNVADIAISIGALAFLVSFYRQKRQTRESARGD